MSLVLMVLNGPQKNECFRVQDGLRIGRSNCDITLRDSKVSNHHATVEITPDGMATLVDVGSSNGIRVNGKKTSSFELAPGVTFQIGPFAIIVKDADELSDKNSHLEEWRKHLLRLVKKAENFGSKQSKNLVPFQKAIALSTKFPDEQYIVGYGPRTASNRSSDILFFLPSSTEIAFSLVPGKNGQAVFTTEMPDIVKLNNKSVQKQTLKNGDEIHFNGRKIKVELLK